MKLVDFNLEQTLIALAKMIIIDELAFKFVENEGWELNKKILKFCLISDHKSQTIGITLENCLKEWGFQKFFV